MSKRKYKAVFDGRCRSEWIALITEWVHDDLDRKMMILHHLDGHTYDRVCDDIDHVLEYKDSNPELARVMYNLSMQEMQHMTDLHALVVAAIDDYRKDNGEPPVGMKTLYDYLHKQHIEDAAKVRTLQGMYAQR